MLCCPFACQAFLPFFEADFDLVPPLWDAFFFTADLCFGLWLDEVLRAQIEAGAKNMNRKTMEIAGKRDNRKPTPQQQAISEVR
jgi:hypothetical protein